MSRIILGDSLEVLQTFPARWCRLAYIDPPFGHGKTQKRERIKVKATSGPGDRGGFGDKRYDVEEVRSGSYEDPSEDFENFLVARIRAALPCLTGDGSLFIHLDMKWVHYIKVAMDRLLGRSHFMNEIIWSYDYGGRSRVNWPAKHDTILWYAMDPSHYVFRHAEVERIPYMAPELVGPEKAARGKTLTNVWWHTIVPTNGREKTGYPTQKPLGILNRIIKVHSHEGDTVLDFFCGSGTTGAAAAHNQRGFVLIDSNPEAVRITAQRLADFTPELVGFQLDKA